MEDSDYEQSREELEAHYGPDGPVQVATRWLGLILEAGDYAAAWPLTDPGYRHWRAETWVAANANHMRLRFRDHALLVEELAETPSTSDLWGAFADTETGHFQAAWSNVDMEGWGWASRPRPYSPGCELVVFTPTDGVARKIEKTTLVAGLQLVMHHTAAGWLVAGPVEAPAPALRRAA